MEPSCSGREPSYWVCTDCVVTGSLHTWCVGTKCMRASADKGPLVRSKKGTQLVGRVRKRNSPEDRVE